MAAHICYGNSDERQSTQIRRIHDFHVIENGDHLAPNYFSTDTKMQNKWVYFLPNDYAVFTGSDEFRLSREPLPRLYPCGLRCSDSAIYACTPVRRSSTAPSTLVDQQGNWAFAR